MHAPWSRSLVARLAVLVLLAVLVPVTATATSGSGPAINAGGAIPSPAGAWVDQPAHEGRGTFGLVADDRDGVATGQVTYRLHQRGFRLTVREISSVVVVGATATILGTGTLDAKGPLQVGAVEVRVDAVDGRVRGDGVDRLRVRVHAADTGRLVYDSEPGRDPAAGATTALDGGSVVIRAVTDAGRPSAVDDTLTTREDTPATLDVLANDTDPDGDDLAVVSLGTATTGIAELAADGTVVYTPAPDATGDDAFTYTVSDGTWEATATVAVTITPVNDDPVADDDSATTPEDTPVTVDVLANDSDVDGDTLEVVATSLAVTGPGSAEVTSDGSIRVVPEADANGTITVAHQVSDGTATAAATLTVTVTPVDDAPVAADDRATTDEDTPVTVDVLANDTDADGDPLTVSVGTAPARGTASVESDGSITYTPAPDSNGTDQFTYRAADDTGLVDEATVTVEVAPVNDAPTAVDDDATTASGAAVTIDVLGNDTDPDGDALTVIDLGTPAAGAATTDGTIVTYTPTESTVGVVSFTYTAGDPDGLTDVATVTVQVADDNRTPTATDDAVTLEEDTSLDITVLANDNDPDGDALVVTGTTTPGNGTATVNPDGTVRYIPADDFNGSDSFSYTVSDPDGLTDTATVAITVTPVNDAPVAVDETATTPEDTPVTVDVLANDSDVDGDTLTVVDALGVTGPGSAELTADGQVLVTPDPDASGTVQVAHLVSDGTTTTSATLTVTVTPVNDPPVATDDTATTDEDTPVTIDVLANDDDVDDTDLTVTVTTAPVSGTATVGSDGSITYTPDPDVNGSDDLTYEVTDPQGASDAATLALAVTPVNDAPLAAATAGPDTVVGDGTPLTFDGTGSDDVDGDTLTYSWVLVDAPDGSSATLTDAATPTAALLPDVPGAYTVSLTVDDGSLQDTASATATALAQPIDVTLRDPLVGIARSTPGEVVLPEPAPPGGLVVDLASSDPAVAAVDDPSVTVLAGQTTASFTVTGVAEGPATITGTPASTYGPGSAPIEITPVFLTIGETIPVGIDEQVSIPLSVSQADPSDLTVSLRSLDTSIATVEATSVIPGGQLAPATNPQATGVALGVTEVVVEAPGVAPDRRTIEVALDGAISPSSIRQPIGWTQRVTVSVLNPAPTGGLVLDVELDKPIADAPSQVTIPGGQLSTSFDLVGTTEGVGTLFVDGIGFDGVQAAVTTLARPTVNLSLPIPRIGTGLQVRPSLQLGFAPEEPTDVTITSEDPAVLLALGPTDVGSSSIVIEDLTSINRTSFNIQAPGDVGTTVTLNLDAGPKYGVRTQTIEIVPSSVRFSSSTSQAFPYPVVSLQPINTRLVTIRPEALTRPGASVDSQQWQLQEPIQRVFAPVTVSTTDATLVRPAGCNDTVGSPTIEATFGYRAGSGVQAGLCVDGIAPTDPAGPFPSLVVSQPDGFTASPGSNLIVEVEPADVVLNGRRDSRDLLAPGLSRVQRVALSYAPPSPVDITLSVPTDAGVTLSASPDSFGSTTLVLPDIDSAGGELFWVHATTPGLGIVGPITATASTADYAPDQVSVNVQYPAVVLSGQLRPATTTIEATRAVSGTVVPAVVDVTGRVLQSRGQFMYPIVAGPDGLVVDVAVGDQDVVTTSLSERTADRLDRPVPVPDGATTVSLEVPPGANDDGLGNPQGGFGSIKAVGRNEGTTSVAVVQPTDFVVPLDATTFHDEDAIEINVVGRPIYDAGRSALVGLDLQTRLPRGRFVDTPLTLTVADPTVASMTGPDGGEVTSLTLPASSNPEAVFVNGLQQGSTVIQLRAEGYTPFDLPVTVGQSTVYFPSGLPSTLDRFDPNFLSNLATGVIYQSSRGPAVLQQPVRPLAGPLSVTVASDTPAVLGIVGSPVTVDDSLNRFQLDPIGVGNATVTIQQPASFTSAPNAADTGIVEVVTDDVQRPADVALGVDHRDILSIVIDNPVPDSRTMTVRSSAPDVVTVSSDPSVPGTAEAARVVTSGDAFRVNGFTVQAIAPGTAQLTVQLPGYTDASFNVVVHPSTVQWADGTSSTGVSVGGSRSLNVEVVGYTPSGSRVFSTDGVRPGAALTVDITSDDPTVAVPASPTLTFDDTASFFLPVSIEGVAAGSTTLRVAPPPGRPGYEPPRSGALTVTVS